MDISDRMKSYEANYDSSIMRRIPLIIRCDGRGFSRVCRKLKKPYEPLLLEAMVNTMLSVIGEMSGSVFGYAQSDEITFVLRNDQSLDSESWYKNRVQKITSITSGLTTLAFNKEIVKMNISLTGDAIFDARVFGMPTISEVVNNLIWRQMDCQRSAISGATQVILGKKFGKKTVLKMIHGKNSKDKLYLLKEECGIDFKEEFPSSFRLGVGVYKVPVVLSTKDGNSETRKKWRINWELPEFIQNRDFIYNIISSGSDVFRAENIIPTD